MTFCLQATDHSVQKLYNYKFSFSKILHDSLENNWNNIILIYFMHFDVETKKSNTILYEKLTSSALDACTEKFNNICCNRAWVLLFSMCCSDSLFAFNITYFKVFTACYYFLVNVRHFSSYFYQQLMMSSKDNIFFFQLVH